MLKHALTTLSLGVAIAAALAAAPARAGTFLTSEAPTVKSQYVVVFEETSAKASGAGPQKLRDRAAATGFTVDREWTTAVRGALVSGLDDDGARELAKMDGVAFVEPNIIGETAAVQTLDETEWGLDRIDQRTWPQPRQAPYTYVYDYTGINVNIYVMDTGVLVDHADFGRIDFIRVRRAFWDYDAVGEFELHPDSGNHGTRVASLAAGKEYGVAKLANIHSVKVCGQNLQCTESDVLEGVDWVIKHATAPAVVNMSFSVGNSEAVKEAARRLWKEGFFVAVAAKNDYGSDACALSPAGERKIYTVASSDIFDQRAFHSNQGPCVDMLAPGESIISAVSTSYSDAGVANGTSLATPQVAGAAALILEQFPTATPAQIEAELNARSTKGVLTDLSADTPNRLLYTRSLGYVAAPGIPATLNVTQSTCTASWSAAGNATYYELEDSTNSGFAGSNRVYQGGNLSFRFVASGVHYFRTRACNLIGCSGYRNGNVATNATTACL
jgi:serine protease